MAKLIDLLQDKGVVVPEKKYIQANTSIGPGEDLIKGWNDCHDQWANLEVSESNREILKNEQLISDHINGDCFRACLTSLLGIPNFGYLPDGGDKEWFIKWSRFLSTLGLSIHYEEKACWRSGYWIASVKSLNFPDVTHAIIMNCQEVYFDPSPNEKYLSGKNLLGKNIVLGGWYLEVENFNKLFTSLCSLQPTVKVPSETDLEGLLMVELIKCEDKKGDFDITQLARAIRSYLIEKGGKE